MYLSFIAFIYFFIVIVTVIINVIIIFLINFNISNFLFIYTRTKLIHLHGVLLNDLQVYCLFSIYVPRTPKQQTVLILVYYFGVIK